MSRLLLSAMLLPPTGMALFGPGLVARCLSPLGMDGMVASLQATAVAALLFAVPICWAMAALLMDGEPQRERNPS